MTKKHHIPTPADPRKRRAALPSQQPKATEEDPEALRRVQAILNSPSYRRPTEMPAHRPTQFVEEAKEEHFDAKTTA